MTWSDFYVICFAVGVGFSVLVFLTGFHFHLHIGDWHIGQVHHGHNGPGAVSPVTIAAFLAWFGGAGFLLQRHSGWWSMFALALPLGAGVKAAAYQEYNQAAVVDRLLANMPEMVRALAAPLANIDKITIVSTGGAETAVAFFGSLYPACMCPCQRFTSQLTIRRA